MNSVLKYKDETDKSLGIAGMAVSLIACDAEGFIACVSMEPDEESIELTEDYFFHSNPRFSAKIAWTESLRHFQHLSGMIISNVLCRNYAAGHSPEAAMLAEMRRIINEEADAISLGEDEKESLYSKHYNYYNRLFSHPTVITVARDFATTLRMHRTMSGQEVLDNLRALSNI